MIGWPASLSGPSAARLIAVLFSAPYAGATFVLARDLAGRAAAWVAAALALVAPPFLEHAGHAMVDISATSLVLVAWATAGAMRTRHAVDVRMMTTFALILGASLLTGFVTYPLIHVIAGTYWAATLFFYALLIHGASALVLRFRRRTS